MRQPNPNGNTISYIKLGSIRVVCKHPRCMGNIQPDELRVGDFSHNTHFGGLDQNWYHPECYSKLNNRAEYEKMNGYNKLSDSTKQILHTV